MGECKCCGRTHHHRFGILSSGFPAQRGSLNYAHDCRTSTFPFTAPKCKHGPAFIRSLKGENRVLQSSACNNWLQNCPHKLRPGNAHACCRGIGTGRHGIPAQGSVVGLMASHADVDAHGVVGIRHEILGATCQKRALRSMPKPSHDSLSCCQTLSNGVDLSDPPAIEQTTLVLATSHVMPVSGTTVQVKLLSGQGPVQPMVVPQQHPHSQTGALHMIYTCSMRLQLINVQSALAFLATEPKPVGHSLLPPPSSTCRGEGGKTVEDSGSNCSGDDLHCDLGRPLSDSQLSTPTKRRANSDAKSL